MQLLIVHDDAEVGGQLAGMVHDYTEHQCEHCGEAGGQQGQPERLADGGLRQQRAEAAPGRPQHQQQ